MRVSENWLREWVDFPGAHADLAARITMAGLEVEATEAAAPAFSGVVVGEIRAVTPHPEADRLRVCRIARAEDSELQIVTGATNVRAGQRVALATVGARLPGGVDIAHTVLRGTPSFGMLCSEKELGLTDAADGILELPADAPLGADVRTVLGLDDVVFELNLTPNRADCLSMEGVAREVAALTGQPLSAPDCSAVPAEITVVHPVWVDDSAACPRYLARLVHGLNPDARTPLWMVERLRRAGLRSLGPVVDVTNYVLLELGQPLHAFDAARLQGAVRVRRARSDESVLLLNEQTLALDEESLVIADDSGPLALAGIMGGRSSAVAADTVDVLLECAFFAPEAMMGRARRFGLHTDSSHRFERGVDPQGQHRAMERASRLLLEIAGGCPGPVVERVAREALPQREAIVLRLARVHKVLGIPMAAGDAARILIRLGLALEETDDGWRATPPSHRFDLRREEDLIEELARVYGYEHVPRRPPALTCALTAPSEGRVALERLQDLLVDRGFREAITYSFVNADLLRRLTPDVCPVALRNPISADLGVMRTTVWAGLLQTALFNLNRREERVRLFESGLNFRDEHGQILQERTLAGLATGTVLGEQWGTKTRLLDFYDLKADVESLLALGRCPASFRFVAASHPALHPGQSSAIVREGRTVGWLGALHPLLERDMGFTAPVFLFEIALDALESRAIPTFQPLSRFPAVRRDLAVVVEDAVPAGEVLTCLRQMESALIRDVWLFDVYRGAGVESGYKSLAIGLHLQDADETLTDESSDAVVREVLQRLAHDFRAVLRGG